MDNKGFNENDILEKLNRLGINFKDTCFNVVYNKAYNKNFVYVIFADYKTNIIKSGFGIGYFSEDDYLDIISYCIKIFSSKGMILNNQIL